MKIKDLKKSTVLHLQQTTLLKGGNDPVAYDLDRLVEQAGAESN